MQPSRLTTARRRTNGTRRACVAGLSLLIAITGSTRMSSQSGQTITSYQLVSQDPKPNGAALFTYRAALTNAGPALAQATATGTTPKPSSGIALVDNALTFGPVGPGGTVWSSDTFSFLGTKKANPSDIVWTITSTSNQPPAANAGPDLTVQVGQTARLDGSASNDPDGDALTYSWSFVSRPAGSSATLVNPTGVKPTFVVDRSGSYTVRLVVSDRFTSAADTVIVTAPNAAPVANAGPDQTLAVGATATLDGSGSSDIDGDRLTYAWSFQSVPLGSHATLSDPSAVHPVFLIDAPGSYVVRLVVNDGTAASTPDTVTISTRNSAPVANAGPDQTVAVTQVVTLDGRGSSDVDGDALSFAWTFVNRPANSAATLANPATANPTFAVDVPGTYVVQLVVNDGQVNSAPDTVSITTRNSPPVANAGPDQTAFVGNTVTLNGSGSTDVDGNAITYAWALVSVPAGSAATFNDSKAVTPTFAVDKPGTYIAQLIVSDGTASSAPDTVAVTTQNSPPAANAGPDQTVRVGQVVLLNGTGSSDVDGDPLAFRWSITSAPASSTAALTSSTSAGPSIVVDQAGDYIIQLIVNDGYVDSAPDTVKITTTNSAPTANAGPDQVEVILGATVTLDGTQSSDPDGQALTYSWSLIARPATSGATLSDPAIAQPVFTPDVPGDYVAQLIVRDGFADSQPDTVLIHVNPRPNISPIANAGQDQQVRAGDTVQLDASGSSDPDGNLLTFQWSFTSKPAGSTAALQNATTANPTFVADLAGAYTLQVTVTDTGGATAADSVTITAVPRVTLTAFDPDAAEGGGDTGIIRFSREGGASAGLTVNVTLGGTATNGVDYEVLGGTISFQPGETFADLTVAPLDDQLTEGPETAVVTLITGAGYALGDLTAATVTIADRPPITLALVNTPVVGVGLTAALQVTLGLPAPAGGVVVTVTSDETNILRVAAPGTTTIAEGGTTGLVTLNGIASGKATVRANAPKYSKGTLEVTATLNVISTPTTLTVPLGQTTQLPITIAPNVAPPGGLVVDVVSANPSIVEVATPQVTVPAGSLSINATVVGTGIGATQVTASNPNYVTSTTTVGTTANINIVQTSAAFAQGFPPPELTVRLESSGSPFAAPANLVVGLTSAVPNCVTTPSSVTILAGQVSTTFQPQYGGAASLPCTATLTALVPGLGPDTVPVTVNPVPSITIPSTLNVGAGLQASANATLGTAQHGGVTVTVASGDPRVLVSRDENTAGTSSLTLDVLNGQISVPYYIQGLESTTGSAIVTVSAPGFTPGTQTVTVKSLGVEIIGLPAKTTTQSANATNWYVQVGIPDADNKTLQTIDQNIRPGGTPIAVTLTNSTASVARLSSDDDPMATGQTVTKAIQAGHSKTVATSPGTFGGLTFDPLAAGTTTVTVTGPPGVATMTTTGVRTVEVTTVPGITMPGTMTVGAGLQIPASATLGEREHGGVTVTVASSEPHVLVSPDDKTPGTASFTLDRINGQTNVPYYIQGLENTTGPAVVTVSAPGFTSGTQAVSVASLGVEIGGVLPDTTTALSGSATNWSVRVGIPNPDKTALQPIDQHIRAGGTPIVVTLTNSTASVARLSSDEPPATGQMVTKPIQVGHSDTVAKSPGTSYGLTFDPLAAGTTTLTVTGPPEVATMTTTGVRTIVVTTVPGITMPGPRTVGAGLQTLVSATLGASDHGGVTVTVASSDPSVLVSPDDKTAGTSSFTLHLLNGQTSVPYYIQGLENTTGSAVVTVSAPGFTPGTHTVTVKSIGVEVIGLPPTTTTLSASATNWFVQVGIPNADNKTLATVGQDIRAGGTPIVVTLTNSTASVGRLSSDEPPATDQTVTKPIQPGRYYTVPKTLGTAGGLTFDPLAAGTTTVTVTGPPGVATMTTSGVRTISVAAAPGISLSNAFTVGAGLQVPTSATLGASQHGGVTVTISSSAPDLVLVSPDATTPGSGSTTVTVANGFISVPFVIQGVENVDATAIVTVSAPGFISDTATVKVTPSAIEIQSLPASVNAALGEVVNAYVQVGIPNATNTALATIGQNVRAGSPGFLVTLTNSNSAVAELKSDEPSAIGQTVTKAIKPNQYYTHAVGSGTFFGWAFRPLSTGTTTVTATGPAGVITTNPGGNRQVSVTGVPTIVTIAATDPDAAEALANTGTFTITRSAASAQPLTVNYAQTGTATAGTDYSSSNVSTTTVTIPANQTSVTVTLTPVADVFVEGPETVTLTLLDATAYDLGAAATQTATVTIADDPAIVSIVTIPPDATEAGPTAGTFRISRVGGLITQFLTVTYVRAGTATAGSDYMNNFSATTVTIPANQTSVTITVTPINDALAEGPDPETVILTLTATANYKVSTQNTATVRIVSDE